MTTIILPTKNEASSIAHTIINIRLICDEPVVVVDGGSTDGTIDIVNRECGIPVIIDNGKGKGAGLRLAFDWAARNGDGDVIFVDTDETYPLNFLPEIIEALEHNDVVIGERVRFHTGSLPTSFKIGDWLSRGLFRLIYSRKLDNLSGFRGLSRRAIEVMDLREDGFGIETEITAKAVRAGLSIKSIPIDYFPRAGEAKFRPIRDSLVVLKAMWRYRAWNPR